MWVGWGWGGPPPPPPPPTDPSTFISTLSPIFFCPPLLSFVKKKKKHLVGTSPYLLPCGGPLARPREVPVQTGTERKTHTMRTSPKQQGKQRDPAFFPDRASVPHEIKQTSRNKMKAGAGGLDVIPASKK